MRTTDPRETGTHQPADPLKEKALTAALVATVTMNPSPAPETMPALKEGRRASLRAVLRALVRDQIMASRHGSEPSPVHPCLPASRRLHFECPLLSPHAPTVEGLRVPPLLSQRTPLSALLSQRARAPARPAQLNSDAYEHIIESYMRLAHRYPREFLNLLVAMPLQPEPEILADGLYDAVTIQSTLITGSKERCPKVPRLEIEST